MSNTITLTLTNEQMKDLQSGKSITIEPPKQVISKWVPKDGNYIVDHLFNSITVKSGFKNERWINSGLLYETKTQAEQAAKALRSYARQLAWIAENDDGWVANWQDDKQSKYSASYDILKNEYSTAKNTVFKNISQIYMSKQNADKLCQLLNAGIVEFLKDNLC